MGDSDVGSVPGEGPRRTVRGESPDFDAWLRCGCALVVAGVAAYASYVHQRDFALQGGADEVSASLWPLSVDGLLLLATVGLLKPSGRGGRRARYVVWLAFLLGIVVSLAANIAAAPSLAWKPVLVAGWPPVALLLSVELLAHRPAGRAKVEIGDEEHSENDPDRDRAHVDPLLERARRMDARHWELHQRPVSAESLRKELRIGADRSRQLVALVRASRNGSVRG
ncbi:DUF2637 domain-containing protein [Streptomyces albicerus]|uniref:DUF2637 domain-containing protein n=1 Tax=Streptomyces albicerus TaxID=2569859 RepID=UPI00124B061B|nr:DUF2637 domain-containing protein [Streptomyces albicerus]